MYCHQLNLVNFKNLEELSVVLSPKFNCFAGHNGVGKTSLLDAIYYLSFCKSFTNPLDSQNIHFGKDFFVIQANYQNHDKSDALYCGFKRGQRKVFKKNKKEYDRLSDHIGRFPLVLLSPSDGQLILGGSDERRKFLDGVIAQYSKQYLDHLISYNKALQQRNALLKIFAEKQAFDESSLNIWDMQLIRHGQALFEERTDFFNAFAPVFSKYYKDLSQSMEETCIRYVSPLDGDKTFQEQLKQARHKDRILQYTTVGIHKDDLQFFIHGEPIKKFGSQGQQKSFIIALKLAQYAFTREVKGVPPMLIFDDVFDKLDPDRVGQLMKLVSREEFGQVFVSDTQPDRLESLFEEIPAECMLFTMEAGKIVGTKTLHASQSE